MLYLDIIIPIGKHYHYGSSSFLSEVFQMGLAIFLALLPIAIGLAIDRAKKKKANKQNDHDHLVHFSNLLTSGLAQCQEQSAYYHKISEACKDTPFVPHKLKLKTKRDLHRLQRMDTKGIFLAFRDAAPTGSDWQNDFNALYGHIDLAAKNDEVGQQVFLDYIEGYQTLGIQIKHLLEDYGNVIARCIFAIKSAQPESYKEDKGYQYLDWAIGEYTKFKQAQVDFATVNEWLAPFKQELLEQFQHEAFADKVLEAAQAVNYKVSDLKVHSENYAPVFKQFGKVFEDTATDLKPLEAAIRKSLLG